MTSFVTGGSGFVGGAVLRHLVESGEEVRALARSVNAATVVTEIGGTPVDADLHDEAALRDGMRGCDVVYHVAGVNTMCPGNPGDMYRTNVDAVRTVVRAAAAADARRVVLTSSAAVIGERDGVVANEETPHSGRFLSHYARSKHLGELAFFDEAGSVGIEAVAVNPSSVQGPGRADGSALLFRYALNARRPIAIDAMLSVVDIDDVARAHLLAASRGAHGERYLISGATVSMRDALHILDVVTGRSIAPIVLPRWVALAAYPIAALGSLLPGDAPVCVEMLRTLLHGHRFDASLSVTDLGVTYTALGDTLARTTAWLDDQGYISR
ncbi:MAG: NAD-dependent epimerase/dehydratase family protein [Actinomycetota bacterium]